MTGTAKSHFGWVMNLGRADYAQVLEWQKGLVRMRREGFARDTLILVEHPPVVTVGRDGHEENFKGLKHEPFFIERGGDVTYHGPGQLVAYFIFNLTRRGRDLHKFMDDIQLGVIQTLKSYGVTARQDDTNTGVWIGDHKIASIGIAVKHWITYHGAAINVQTELSDFDAISPCGLKPDIMTSLKQETGNAATLEEFGDRLVEAYTDVFDTDFAPVTLDELAEDIESQAGGYEI